MEHLIALFRCCKAVPLAGYAAFAIKYGVANTTSGRQDSTKNKKQIAGNYSSPATEDTGKWTRKI